MALFIPVSVPAVAAALRSAFLNPKVWFVATRAPWLASDDPETMKYELEKSIKESVEFVYKSTVKMYTALDIPTRVPDYQDFEKQYKDKFADVDKKSPWYKDNQDKIAEVNKELLKEYAWDAARQHHSQQTRGELCVKAHPSCGPPILAFGGGFEGLLRANAG